MVKNNLINITRKVEVIMKKFITVLLVAILSVGAMVVPSSAKTTSKVVNVSALKKIEGACVEYGKEIYYVKTVDKKNSTTTTLYKCTKKGTNVTKLQSFSGSYTIGAIYNKKIYVSTGNETKGYKTFAISKLGKGKKTLVKTNLKVYSGSGKYMVGISSEPTDIGPKQLCVYNAQTNKKQSLGQGYSPVIVGKKVYYAVWDKQQKRYVVAHNVLGSTKRTVDARFPKSSNIYVKSVNEKRAVYYVQVKDTVKTKVLKY